MTAPLLWIFIPGAVALILLLIRRWEGVVLIAGTLTTLVLALIARLVPIGTVINIGTWSVRFAETYTILGRRLILQNQDRPILALVYLIAAIWFVTAYVSRPGSLFVPLGLGLVPLLIAALAVDPFLYAALFIEAAALLVVPIIVQPGTRIGRGVIRFLSFQTLGVPFILFTGWMLAGVEASPGDLDLVLRAAILLGFGFAFLLGIFPFHSWLPLLAQEANPYSAGYLLLIFPGIISLLGLSFFDRYAWLRNAGLPYTLLGLAGVFMVFAGGLWAAFQRHFGRVFGFAMVFELGMVLMAASVRDGQSLLIFFEMFPPRILGALIWACALSQLMRSEGSLDNEALRGAGRRRPLVAAGLLAALFSLAGLPLLAGFPARLTLWRALALENSFFAAGSMLGSALLGLAGIRALLILFGQNEEQGASRADRVNSYDSYFVIGILVLALLGLFPQWLAPFVNELARAYPNIAPGV